MADGSSGNLGGILYEAGKSVTDAGKQAVQSTAGTVFQQVTGKTPTGGSFSNASTTPKNFPGMNKLGDLGGSNPLEKILGGKNPLNQANQQQQNAQNQQQFQQMQQQNKSQDEAQIAALTRELHEKYFKPIRDGGKLAEERQKIAEEKQADEQAQADKKAAQQQQGPVKPGELGGNLPSPVNQQAPSRNFEGSKPTG